MSNSLTPLKSYDETYTDNPVYSSRNLGWIGLRLELFEAPGASMPETAYGEHHLMINHRQRHLLRQRRDRKWLDLALIPGDFVLTPAGMVNTWEWKNPSRVIAITMSPLFLRSFAANELSLKLNEE